VSRRPIRLLSSLAAAAVLASVFAAGGIAASQKLAATFRSGPEVLVPPDIGRALDGVRRAIPSDAPVLYVSADTDTWRCGLWQRLLYPRPVFCLRPAASSHSELPSIRRAFDIRYAIGTGPPSPDLSIVRTRDLGEGVWLGELAP